MISTTETVPRTEHVSSAQSGSTSFSIVLGTDGDSEAAGAIRLARLFSERDGTAIRVVGVLDRFPPASSGGERVGNRTETAKVGELRERIEYQLAGLGVPAGKWPVEIVVGRPDVALSDVAERERARLLLVGTSGQGLLGRVWGPSTVLSAARHARATVLAVRRHTSALPECAVVGIDFGSASIAAARAALDCLGPRGSLHVAYSRPVGSQIGTAALAAGVAYDEELAERLERVTAALSVPAGVRVTRHVLVGDAARQLLELAEREKADLIAVGTHGDHRLAAFMIGTTASRVLAADRASVLIAPAHSGVDGGAQVT